MSIYEQITACVEELAKLSRRLPMQAALGEIQELGLQTGFETTEAEKGDMSNFFSRLSKDRSEKAALAKYLCRTKTTEGEYPSMMAGRKDGDREHLLHPFFECGSTIAYVIGEFARGLECADPVRVVTEDSEPDIVLSNNMFCGSALANLVSEVVTVSGYLTTKYAGHLPCPEREGSNEIVRSRFESKFYSRLAEDIATCDRILATCSNFSFVAGPLVGSRANAIAKHAIGSARDDACQYATCFTFSKLLPITQLPKDIGDDVEMLKEQHGCRRVFPHGTNVQDVDLGVTEGWHRNWLTLAPNPEIERFKTQIKRHVGAGALPRSWRDSWGDIAPGTYVIIALPQEHGNEIKEWLNDEELPAAERVMAKLKNPMSFKLSNNTRPEIAEIHISN